MSPENADPDRLLAPIGRIQMRPVWCPAHGPRQRQVAEVQTALSKHQTA
jgi:hypothetical protein